MLCNQPNRVTEAGCHSSALIDKISAGFRVQCFDIDRRIVEEPTCDLAAKRCPPALIAVRHMFVHKCVQPFIESDR